MRDFGKRMNTIEKKLRVGRHQEPAFPRISIALFGGRKTTDEDRQSWGRYRPGLPIKNNYKPEKEPMMSI